MKKKIRFYNDYILDIDFEDGKMQIKDIDVDFDDRQQLFNILKKRGLYKTWQPARENRTKMLRSLEDIYIKEEKALKERRQQRAKNNLKL